ncbi:MAG: hypothetical protein EBU84_19125 [Actinobacteria bacterium]|nr:hypothetical protein [Actinomycetota bacterium]
MANLSLSTQIPQIGDSSQQLLARMAAAAADQNQQLPETTWLSSAARTTSNSINVVTPRGAIGILFRVYITAVPGVQTLTAMIWDGNFFHAMASTAAVDYTTLLMIMLKVGAKFEAPSASPNSISAGLTPNLNLYIAHSGANPFTYSATYQWLKQ